MSTGYWFLLGGLATLDVPPSVEIRQGEKATVMVGRLLTLTVRTRGNPILTWESSDPLIATVSDGVVTGVSAGTCTVTVKATNDEGEDSDSIEIRVIEPPPPYVPSEKKIRRIRLRRFGFWRL